MVLNQEENIKIIESLQQTKEDLRLPSCPSNLLDITKQDTYREDNFLSLLYNQQLRDESIAFDEQIITAVTDFGYPRDYVMKCLSGNELNYATTSYLLLHFLKKYNDYRSHSKSHFDIIRQQTSPSVQGVQLQNVVNPQNSVCSSIQQRG